MNTPPSRLDLDTCLDPEVMRGLLEQGLPDLAAGDRRLRRVRISKARRSASRQRHPHPLTLCYELELDDGGTRRCYAKVYRHGAAAAAAADPRAVLLAPLDMLLWTWPDDPGLPQLPELLDPQRALAWRHAAPCQVELLRYEPEQRATLRCTQGTLQFYAKTFGDDRGAAIHGRFEHFWALAQHDGHAPLVARPLGWQRRTRTVWQARAAGQPLEEVLAGRASQPLPNALPVRLARALAVLHAAQLPVAAQHDLAHWLQEARRREIKIGRAVPELAVRAGRLVEQLEDAADTLPPGPRTLIHGDFHAGQVGVDGQRIVLFDFDEFALGDPLEDLAAFVTRLPAAGAPAEFGTLLVAAYAQAAPEQFSRRRLHWHLALQMLLQASRAFVFQVEGWRAELERRLACAEALCQPAFRESL